MPARIRQNNRGWGGQDVYRIAVVIVCGLIAAAAAFAERTEAQSCLHCTYRPFVTKKWRRYNPVQHLTVPATNKPNSRPPQPK